MRKVTPQTQLIGISGKQYTGKDYLCDLLLARLPGFRKLPLALAIKQQYAAKTGLTLEAIERDKAAHRPALIELGQWGRAQDPDYWLKQVLDAPGRKIVSDVRMQREYALLRTHGAFMIRIEADREIRARRGTLVNEFDATECDLDNITDWDAVLVNNTDAEALIAQLEPFFD